MRAPHRARTMLTVALVATLVGGLLPAGALTLPTGANAPSPSTGSWGPVSGATVGMDGDHFVVASSGLPGSGVAAPAERPGDRAALVVEVRATASSLDQRVRAVIEDPVAGARTESAPALLAPYWQRVGVTAPAGAASGLLLSVVEDGSGWAAGDGYEVRLVSFEAAAITTASTSGRQMLVDGSPYTIKGYTYAAGPIGTTIGFTGTNLASWHTSPAHCQSDADLMAKAGINTLRIHFLDVYDTRALQCMDAFAANDVGLIWLVNGPAGLQFGDDNWVEAFWVTLSNVVEQVKDHPATLGYNIGNEIQRTDSDAQAEWFRNLETLAARTKQLDPSHVTSTSITSGGQWTRVQPTTAPSLDMWGVNRYGSSTGYPSTVWSDIETRTTRPVWFSEFGIERYHCPLNPPAFLLQVALDYVACPIDLSYEDSATQVAWNSAAWEDIAANLSADDPTKVMAGATMFMWADWWAFAFGGINGFGTEFTHDLARRNEPGGMNGFPERQMNAEWWGSTHALRPDMSGPRVTLPMYDAMAAAFRGSPGPSIDVPVVANIGSCAVTLSWTTDVPTTMRVDFGLEQFVAVGNALIQDNYVADQHRSSATFATTWTYRLAGLRQGQAYRAYVRAYDASGRIASAAPVRFTTAATGPGNECSVT